MTSASEWNAIAEACEAAEGPSREIDTRIACRLFAENGFPAAVKDNAWIATALTSSLDAITETIKWEFSDPYFCIDRVSRKDGRDWFAMVSGLGWSPKSLGMTTEVFNEKLCAHARTYVLALCAAFCRAMAVKAENEAKGAAE